MRAAVMRAKRLVVADLPVPEPGPGEVLVKTLACGICGSDLHALRHAEKFVEISRRAGTPFAMDLARDVVMGHEFCAEIVEHGPGTTRQLRVCMEQDTIWPMLGIGKELGIQFVYAYRPEEFAATLGHIASGDIAAGPLITGTVGVDGVAQAFEDLASPDRHAKVLVEPWR